MPKTTLRFNKLVPADSFIGRYMSYFSAQETATSYDFWCALWLLSCAMGRDAYIKRPRIPVYFNMYVILAADSGVTRKSTAVLFAQDVIRTFCDGLTSPMHVLEGKIVPEHLETILTRLTDDTDHAYLAFSSSELVTVLGREGYLQSLPGLLTDLYDSRASRIGGGTISKGDRVSRNIYVCFLSASTPVWLLRSINPDVVEGGFTSRCFFVVDERPKGRVAWFGEEGEPREQVVDQFARSLRTLRADAASVRGIDLSPSALTSFTRWYKKRTEHRDPFRASFYSREDSHVLRTAGLLCINDQTYVVQDRHIGHAIKLVEDVRERGARLFDLGREGAAIVGGVSKVRDRLIRSGRDAVAQSILTIAGRPSMTGADVRTCLDIMHELGYVQKFEHVHHGKRGAPKTLWRATNKLTDIGVLDAITQKLME